MMSEVKTILKQIEDLKGKLKIAKKKEEEAKKIKLMKLLEENGILDLDEAQIVNLIKAAKRPPVPEQKSEGQVGE